MKPEPDLLTALKTVLGDADHGQNMTWAERIRIGRDAIKRAEGRAAGGEQVRSPVIRASEHLSPERRRGLEEAAKELSHRAFLCHTHDAFGKGRERGLLDGVAYIRSLIPPSSEGGEEKTDHPPAHRSGK